MDAVFEDDIYWFTSLCGIVCSQILIEDSQILIEDSQILIEDSQILIEDLHINTVLQSPSILIHVQYIWVKYSGLTCTYFVFNVPLTHNKAGY